MRINIKANVKGYTGNDLKSQIDPARGVKKPAKLTVRDILNEVINGTIINQQGRPTPASAEEKGRIYQLSTKLWNAKKNIKFSVEEAAFIKKRAGQVVNVTPLIYGRVCDLLEQKDVKTKEKITPAEYKKGQASKV